MALKRASENTSGEGGFFKPADHSGALALLFLPKSIRKDVPNTFKGVTRNRDEVTADIHVFLNQDHLDGKTPPVTLRGVTVAQPVITKALEPEIAEGGAVTGVVRKLKGSENDYWALQDPDAVTFDKIVAYVEKLEAEKAAALADMPDF